MTLVEVIDPNDQVEMEMLEHSDGKEKYFCLSGNPLGYLFLLSPNCDSK